jgi:aspartyl-tRNA(Asn)/glutamyl-tRNA(Gln) amidotransferase subunit A
LDPFTFSSIEQYEAQLHSGKTTCVQTVQHYLTAIDLHKHLNAFVEVYAEEALQRASQLDDKGPRGSLHGVVVALKDNICYSGHSVSAASKILQPFTSLYSATAVEKLLAAGAIIIGRVNCDEFGMGSTNEHSTYGPVLNPVNNSFVAGGSSGGSAAAVKAGLCMVSLGSDTGGSVRLPAAFCGTVGLKPTYGRVSRHGLIAYASSFDQIGVLANNVADAGLVLSVISGADAYDSTASSRPWESPEAQAEDKQRYRIAYFPEWVEHPSLDPEIAAGMAEIIARLKDQGHEVKPVSFPLTDYIVPTYYVLTTAEASSNLSRYDGVRYGYKKDDSSEDLRSFYQHNRSGGFGAEVKRRILLGTFVLSSGYYDAYFTRAQQVRRLLLNQTDLIFKDFDIIISPTSTGRAYPLGNAGQDPLSVYMGDIFTVFANLTGIPAVSLPAFKHSSNLPLGFQAHANRFNEVSLLRFSHQLMLQ